MEIHRAAYRWTSEELVVAMRHHMASQIGTGAAWGVGLALILGAMVSIALFLSQLIYGAPEHAVLYLILPIMAGLWCVHLADNTLALRRARRAFSRDPGADQMIEWEVSAKEVKYYQRGLFYTARAWKSFVKITEAEDGFLLYSQESIFYWLPFRAFDSPEAPERVREFARASGVSYRKIAG